MINRRLKQLIYGAFFAAIIFGLVYGIYFLLKPKPTCFDKIQNQGETGIDCGGPCQACLDTIAPLQTIGSVKILPLNKGYISLLAEIKNSNTRFGAESFDYVFSVYDAFGNLLLSRKSRSFIYAGEIKYLLEPNLNFLSGQIGRIEIGFSNINWIESLGFFPPKLRLQNQITNVLSNRLFTEGLVVNEGSLSLSGVYLLALYYDQTNQLVGAATTEINDLASQESRNFVINHPFLSSVAPQLTKLFVTGKSERF